MFAAFSNAWPMEAEGPLNGTSSPTRTRPAAWPGAAGWLMPGINWFGGRTLRPTCGYRGSRELLTDLTNTLLDHREPVSQAARHGVLGRSRTTCTPRDLRPSVASTWDTGKSEPRSQSDTRASDVITESHEESMC